jgi:WD40 repeat protein
MSKRSISGESSTAAHKRQAANPQDEEDPLPSARSSSSSLLAHPASSLSPHLIADVILPFVADRATWNSVCSASNDLRLAAKKMTPPWLNKSFNVGSNVHARHLAFAPSGSHLAFSTNNCHAGQFFVHVWDRWGRETLLGSDNMSCLEHSLDGEHLAPGSGNGSIRIWHAESFRATPSNPDSERPTRTPQQADKILLASRSTVSLSFSWTDSNVLASGGSNGEIKVWNIKEEACVHSFSPRRGPIRSLFFAGGADATCLAAARRRSVIRLWRAESSSDLASETMGEADPGELFSRDDAVFSPSGFFLANSFGSMTGNGSTVALCELETMTKTQSIVMPGFVATCFALSADSKQLVIGDSKGRNRLLQTDDFSVQRDLEALAMQPVWSVAFDPSCRFLAFGWQT